MSYIFSYLIPFFELKVFDALSISEVSILLLIIAAVKHNPKLSTKSKNGHFLFILFFLWIIISYFFLQKNTYFHQNSFFNNTIRAITYLLGFIYIPSYIANTKFLKDVLNHLLIILFVLSIIGIVEFVLKQIGTGVDFSLISLFVHNSYNPNFTRVRAIFSEPAHYAIFLSLFAGVLLYAKENGINIKNTDKVIIVVFIACILSLSLNGYIFLTVLAVWFYKIRSEKANFSKKFKYLFLFSVIIILLLIVVFNTPVFRTLIFDRLSNVFEQEDGSANLRLFGQYEVTKIITQENMVFGVGWGQQKNYIDTIVGIGYFNFFWNDGETSGINNIISNILIQTGFVGLILYLSFFFNVLKKSRYLIIIFILLLFAWGFAMSPIMWIFVYLIKSIEIVAAKTKLKDQLYQKQIK